MSQQYDNSYREFKCGATALQPFVRVKLYSTSPDVIVVAGASENCIGVTQKYAGIGAPVSVKLLEGGEGTFKVTCSGPVACNAALYGTASGKVDDSGSGVAQFTAAEAGSGDGSIIECYKRIPNGTSTFVAGDAVASPAAQTQDTLTLTGMTGTGNTSPAAETNTHTLTDNGGGTADQTVASQAAPVTLTDNTGLSGSHDDTLAAVTTFTPSVAWDGSVHPSAADATAIATAITVLNQNASDAGQKIIELVTLAGVAQANLKEVTTELALQKSLNTVLINDGKSFATELNAVKTDLGVVRTQLIALLVSMRAAGTIGT